MVGRLSTYAKNRILNLRFQNNYKIKHIAQTLLQEDNIKVSRESISTFLKKYIDTKSINDKPRSGRNKKLTPEEINLIGEVTRLNRDITAPKIKQYLNLNVSTHTILRASKLFEWNKNNPNSNEAKKAAALERQLNGESKRRSKSYRTKKNANESQQINDSMDASQDETTNKKVGEEEKLNDSHNLNLVTEKEILTIKNISSSPMVFATKILMKLFRSDELHGHNVSGKTFSKNVKNKKALDEKRIKYIRWLVENNFETSNREQLWKMCRTAINKIILINEKKQTKMQLSSNKEEMDGSLNDSSSSTFVNNSYEQKDSSLVLNNSEPVLTILSPTTAPQLGTKTTIVKLNDTEILDDEEDDAEDEIEEEENKVKKEFSESNNKRNNSNKFKKSANKEANNKNSEIPISTIRTRNRNKSIKDNEENIDRESFKNDDSYDLKLLQEKEILLIKNLYCSPMIFSTKVLTKIFTTEELCGHNLTTKTFHKKSLVKPALDEKRLNYIKWLVEKYFDSKNSILLWKSCRKAMCRVLRNIDKKSSQAKEANHNKDEDEDETNEEMYSDDYQTDNNGSDLNKTTVVVLIDDPKILEEQQIENNRETTNNNQDIELVDDKEFQRLK